MASTTELALKVRSILESRGDRLVLAESCTAGQVASALAVIPGISQWLCGSFVVYRNDSKARWLNVPTELLDDPQIGPVSHQVTELLCSRALAATPEATVGAAVTGHIGPGCPAELDGKVFFCLIWKGSIFEAETTLSSPAPENEFDLPRRRARLKEATRQVLQWIAEGLR